MKDLLTNKSLAIECAWDWFKLRQIEDKVRTDHLIRYPAYLGIEFEYERTGVHWASILKPDQSPYAALRRYFTACEDGSLRGEDALELKFKAALNVNEAEKALVMLSEHAPRFSVSRRTGLHVHLSVGDMEHTNLRRLLALYALFEPAIFTAAGDERSANPFTVPWFKDHHISGVAAQIASSPSYCTKGGDRGFGKYGALNLRSLFSYGTVEWRHMRNTQDFNRIFAWVNMILTFRKSSENILFDAEFSRALDTGEYVRLLEWMYGGDPWGSLLYYEMEQEINTLSCDLASEIFYAKAPGTVKIPTVKPAKAHRKYTVLTSPNWRNHISTRVMEAIERYNLALPIDPLPGAWSQPTEEERMRSLEAWLEAELPNRRAIMDLIPRELPADQQWAERVLDDAALRALGDRIRFDQA